jgi:DNA-3-methyladenine glycosylase I
MTRMNRCAWAGLTDPLMLAYHDDEWGLPSRNPRHVFEMLILEGAQAGLSWSTILRKRDGYRNAFAGFDAETVAAFGPADVERLMADPGIVRNRAKIGATIDNARAALVLRDDGTSLVDHVWSFVDGQPIQNRWPGMGSLPAETVESAAMSRDLRRRGFRFVGPTICYAFMHSIGIVNDHTTDCFRWAEVQEGGISALTR